MFFVFCYHTPILRMYFFIFYSIAYIGIIFKYFPEIQRFFLFFLVLKITEKKPARGMGTSADEPDKSETRTTKRSTSPASGE